MTVDSKVDPKTTRRALGRGLEALLPSARATAPALDATAFSCPIERIAPQPGQPRQYFDEANLEELTASIREHGIIEPIVVRRAQAGSDRFEIIAGERRWRAAQRAGLTDVLVVVKDVSPKDAFELALVENLQRADLNPLETAEAFDRLVREHGYTAQSLAERLGKDRTTVANALRLLKVPSTIRSMIISGELSGVHALALLGAPTEKSMIDIAEKTIRGRLAVRKVEELVRADKQKLDGKKSSSAAPTGSKTSANLRDLEARLMRRLGTRVRVQDRNGAGDVVISYGSLDELDRVLGIVGA